MTKEKRDRGILTPKDREYLLGEKVYEDDQQEINRRAYIRNRIKNAILDFNIILENLEESDRKQIVTQLNNMNCGCSSSELEFYKEYKKNCLKMSVISQFAFLYLSCQDANISFESALEKGVQLADEDIVVMIDLIQPGEEVEAAAKKIIVGEDLSGRDLDVLRQWIKENRDEKEEL